MPFDPRTVGPRIRMLLPDLTPSEARITEILLRSDGEAALPLKEVAKEAEASEAMVVKTAKRLGFSGYKELRSALQAYKSQPHVDLHQEVKPDDTAETIVQKVFRTSIQALEETVAIMTWRRSVMRRSCCTARGSATFTAWADRRRSRATSPTSSCALAYARPPMKTRI